MDDAVSPRRSLTWLYDGFMGTRDTNGWKSASPRVSRRCAERCILHAQGAAEILPEGGRPCLRGLSPLTHYLSEGGPDRTFLRQQVPNLPILRQDHTDLGRQLSKREGGIVEKWFARVASVPLSVIQPDHMLRACTDVKLSDVTASRTARGAHPILG